MFFVCPQGIVENDLVVGGRGRCRVSPRHECKSGASFVVKTSAKTSRFVGAKGSSSRSDARPVQYRMCNCTNSLVRQPFSLSTGKLKCMARSAFGFTTSPNLFFFFTDSPSFSLKNSTRSQLRK